LGSALQGRCLRSGFALDLVESPQRASERSFAATLTPQQRRWLARQSALLMQQGRFDALDALAAEWDDEGWAAEECDAAA